MYANTTKNDKMEIQILYGIFNINYIKTMQTHCNSHKKAQQLR